MTNLRGLHHVTATADGSQEDLDFFTGSLGLRLVKKTVNFDNPGVYHFYYGNERGDPGTLMTTFPYRGRGVVAGRKGSGQITSTAFSVPRGSLGFWKERLAAAEPAEVQARFGEPVLALEDPSGLTLELIETDDPRPPWTPVGVSELVAIRGIHSVTLSVRDPDSTLELLTGPMGLTDQGQEGLRHRVAAKGGGPGGALDLVASPEAPAGVNGLGTVHHVALAIPTDSEQLELRHRLLGLGLAVTEVRDRQYFRSIYFREPGGVLLEVATEPPGFLVDEDLGGLGASLKLPPWEEPRRSAIEGQLPEVEHR